MSTERTSEGDLLARYRLAFNVARHVNSTLDPNEVMGRAVDLLMAQTEAERGFVMLRERDGVLVPHALRSIDRDEVDSPRFVVSRTIIDRAVEDGQPVLTGDALEDSVLGERHSIVAMGLRSILAVPLTVRDRAEGVIYLDDTRRTNAFDTLDLEVVSFLSEIIALAIHNARLYQERLELERLKTGFIERVSHELRTPLTIISGLVDTLLDRRAEIDEGRRRTMLERVRTAGGRLEHLILELLTTATIEAAALDVRPVRFSVRSVLEQARSESADPGCVQIDCPAQLELCADPLLVRHALDRLVKNAIAYGGGAILEAGVVDGGIEVAVRDHGPGIPAELRELVFQRFVRGAHTAPGMGMGLFVVRMLANRMGAEVALEHPPDDGLRVRLCFPAHA